MRVLKMAYNITMEQLFNDIDDLNRQRGVKQTEYDDIKALLTRTAPEANIINLLSEIQEEMNTLQHQIRTKEEELRRLREGKL